MRLLLSDVPTIALFGVGLLGFGLTALVCGPFVSTAPAVWYAVLGTFDWKSAGEVWSVSLTADGRSETSCAPCIIEVEHAPRSELLRQLADGPAEIGLLGGVARVHGREA